MGGRREGGREGGREKEREGGRVGERTREGSGTTWTSGELESCERMCRNRTLVCRCCPEPIPPTYRCRQPRTRECPILGMASRVDLSVSKLAWAIWDMKFASPPTCDIRPRASPAAHRSMGSELARAPWSGREGEREEGREGGREGGKEGGREGGKSRIGGGENEMTYVEGG